VQRGFGVPEKPEEREGSDDERVAAARRMLTT